MEITGKTELSKNKNRHKDAVRERLRVNRGSFRKQLDEQRKRRDEMRLNFQ